MARNTAASKTGTVEPRYNGVPRDWQNLFAKTRFRYVEILFHIFSYYWGKKNCSLYQVLRLQSNQVKRTPQEPPLRLFLYEPREKELAHSLSDEPYKSRRYAIFRVV